MSKLEQDARELVSKMTIEEVAKQLNIIMTKLYEKVKDVEFMVMGIGDFAYDRYPLQVSQFE